MRAVDVGLYSKLSADTALVALLSADTPMFNMVAPPNTDMPYVIFFGSGGGPDNITPSDLRSMVYGVKGVASTLNAAASIDARIDTLLHNNSITVSGYTNIWLARETEVQLVEDAPDGNPIYHYGAYYRIRID